MQWFLFLWFTPSVKACGFASSLKGAPFGAAAKFPATANSRPLGEGGIAAGDDGRGNHRQRTLSVFASQIHLPRKGEVLGAPGRFLVAPNVLQWGERRAPSQSKPCGFARFPFLSPAVTSSPGAGEVFPQRESQEHCGSFLIASKTLVMNFTAWLPPWGSWRGSA